MGPFRFSISLMAHQHTWDGSANAISGRPLYQLSQWCSEYITLWIIQCQKQFSLRWVYRESWGFTSWRPLTWKGRINFSEALSRANPTLMASCRSATSCSRAKQSRRACIPNGTRFTRWMSVTSWNRGRSFVSGPPDSYLSGRCPYKHSQICLLIWKISTRPPLSARRWCTSTRGSISRSSCLMRIQTKMISWEGKFFFITSEEARSLCTSALRLRCENRLCCNLPAIRRRDKTCGTARRVLIKVWKQGILLKGIIKHKEGEVSSTVLSPRAETIDFFAQGCNTSHSFDYIQYLEALRSN